MCMCTHDDAYIGASNLAFKGEASLENTEYRDQIIEKFRSFSFPETDIDSQHRPGPKRKFQ